MFRFPLTFLIVPDSFVLQKIKDTKVYKRNRRRIEPKKDRDLIRF